MTKKPYRIKVDSAARLLELLEDPKFEAEIHAALAKVGEEMARDMIARTMPVQSARYHASRYEPLLPPPPPRARRPPELYFGFGPRGTRHQP